MNIKYINYSDDLIKESISFQYPKVYVFDNRPTMIKALDYFNQNKNILDKESLFIMKEDLWDRLFITDNIIIKEDKANLIFYGILDQSDRRFFNVDNYFDVIDTAVEFFHFFDFLNKNLIDINQLDLDVKWQQERLDKFKDLRKRYKKKLRTLRLVDKVLKRDFSNFNTDYIDDFNKIEFVNILHFNRLDKKILNRLKKKDKELKLILKLNENDFDQKKLCIKSFTFPKIDHDKINIYSSQDQLIQFVNLIAKIEKRDNLTQVINLSNKEDNFEKIISQNLVNFERNPSFTESKLYQFIEELYNNLSSFKLLDSDHYLNLNQLLKSTYTKSFKDYYDLTEGDLKDLKERSKEEYVYLDKTNLNIINNKKINKIIKDLKKLKKLDNMKGLINFLKDINIKKLKEDKYKGKDLEQYFDSLLELETIGLLNIDNFLKQDQNFADQLLRLVINYMEFKSIKINKDKENIKADIKTIKQSAWLNRDYLIMFNVNQGSIPDEYDNDTFLTNSDLDRLGLNLKEIDYLKQKLTFFNHIFSSNQADLFYIENIDKNITGSSFIEELLIEYGIKESKPIFIEDDQKKIINQIFKTDSLNEYKDLLDSEIFKEDRMEMEINKDLFNKKLSMNHYKHETLKRCSYKFFMEYIMNIEEENYNLTKELGLRMIGIIAHHFFEEVINKYGLNLKNNYRDQIEEILKDILNRYDLHIHHYFKKYYHDILFDSLIDSIFTLDQSIKNRINKIDSIETEVSLKRRNIYKSQENVEVYISGRPDLLIKTEDNSNYIIDFKTGKGSIKQLALYSLMLNYKKRDFSKTSKSIYRIMDNSLKISNKEIEEKLEDEIIDELDNLFAKKIYKRIYKSSCKECSYYDLCRVVIR
ncbi:MAG: PD-(D/E)XK nuclease family protein [Halanaerobiales bacterium]|nr:PD-(D/E)XK nuclease family protein [Halanaerobiales bacterium]